MPAAAARVRRLGVMGGTFDPIHVGHLVTASVAADRLDLDAVAFVPAGEPWQKAHRPVTPAHHRLAMTTLATVSDPKFMVSSVDIARGGPTYAVDTLRDLGDEFPSAQIFLLLGADAAAGLHSWRSPAELARRATLAVMRRPGQPVDLTELPVPATWVDVPQIDISSTEVRRRRAAGRSVRHMVPDPVLWYMDKWALYEGAG